MRSSDAALAVGATALLWIGCLTADEQPRRTDLTQWKVERLEHAGILLEMPAKHFRMQLHERRNAGIGDSEWRIYVSVQKLPPEKLKKPQTGDGTLLDLEQYRWYREQQTLGSSSEWVEWLSELHERISIKTEQGILRHYRLDVPTSDGNFASIHVTYDSAGFTDIERRADEEAIIRILTSAKAAP